MLFLTSDKNNILNIFLTFKKLKDNININKGVKNKGYNISQAERKA